MYLGVRLHDRSSGSAIAEEKSTVPSKAPLVRIQWLMASRSCSVAGCWTPLVATPPYSSFGVIRRSDDLYARGVCCRDQLVL